MPILPRDGIRTRMKVVRPPSPAANGCDRRPLQHPPYVQDYCSRRRPHLSSAEPAGLPQPTVPSLQSPITEFKTPSTFPEHCAHVIQQEPIIRIYHFLGTECSGLWRRARALSAACGWRSANAIRQIRLAGESKTSGNRLLI